MATNQPPLPSNAELAAEWVRDHAHGSYAGQHGDDALYAAACALYHGFDLREGAIELLRLYNDVKCSPSWPEHRLQHKVKQAASAPQKHAAGGLAKWMLRKKGLRTVYRGEVGVGAGVNVSAEPQAEVKTRLQFDLQALAREVRDVPAGIDVEWLVKHSPVPVEDLTPTDFLNSIYLKGEKVLIFTHFYSQGDYAQRIGGSMWRLAKRPGVLGVKSALPRGGADGVWFLNQPVSGEWKINPRSTDDLGRPKMSRRSEEVVTSWRYLVLESDEAPANLWVRFLVKLPLPIVAIYTSAGRSIHALVKVDAPNKQWWDSYKNMISGLLSKLGADPAAITALRLTRLPGCYRNGKLQRLLYLDPTPEPKTPILWREGGAS